MYHDYGRILKHRNTLLRTGDTSSLDVWSDRLADTGAQLVARRRGYLDDIRGDLQEYYRQIAGDDESVDIAYRPHGVVLEGIVETDRQRLSDALRKTSREEQRMGSTVVGPHRDDVEFTLNGRLLRQHASQGQQRSYILALKMAEIEYLQSRFGDPPVLLIDDISSELDRERNRNLMTFLSRKQMQVFLTTTNIDTLMLEGIEQYRTFLVHDGKVVQ
jgi:DNA replication and repair protein RecF